MRWILCLGLAAVAVVATADAARPVFARESSADPFFAAAAALGGARSDKVRAQAALVLGRRREARAVPALVRALSDPSAAVRAVSARALGEIGDVAAREPLEAASNDADPFVRRAATAALAALAAAAHPAEQGTIVVKSMGDKTQRASPRLRDDMRRFVTDELAAIKEKTAGSFSIDGAIKTLGTSSNGAQVAVTCGVELILSDGRHGKIIVTSTGEATVQRQRRVFHPAMQSDMEQEALAHAVRGATDELRQHLAANVP